MDAPLNDAVRAMLDALTPAQLEHIAELVRNDALTGLGNRRSFDERLELELGRSARSRKPFALIFFKLRTLSEHEFRGAARALRDAVRLVDFAARTDGDSFAMILVDVNIATARAVGQRLLDAMGVQARAGVAGSFPVDTAATLIERAQAALEDAHIQGISIM